MAAILPKPLPDMPTVKSDDTIVEVAAVMARERARWSPWWRRADSSA